MAKAPPVRGWRSFYDRVLKDQKYQRSIDPKRYGPYRTYRDQFVRIDRLVKRYPRNIVPIPIGASVDGETIWAFRASNVKDAAEPRARTLVLSLLHSIEFIGAEANIALLERFAANMNKNPSLHDREVHFVPILNPDGYLAVEEELANGKSRFRRGNRRGVDLNRNFSVFYSRRAALARLLPKVYDPGPRPFSEPETSALRSHLLQYRFDFALSLHSFGGRLLYPYGGSRARTKDDAWFRETAKTFIECQPHHGYKAGQIGRFLSPFLIRCAEADYLYETFGTRAFILELVRGPGRLFLPGNWTNPFALFNPKDPEREIENLMDAFFFFLTLDRPKGP